jgi:UDP-N-acetyl-D-glucosamine/UDP-N-acetyl-D-galactosamine dehydrogenase
MKNNIVISVTGLGYVGIPLAVAFAKKFDVIGFDINQTRINELRAKVDRTGEVAPEELQQPRLTFTSEAQDLRKANFHIVTVPTPVNDAHQPDLGALISASESVGRCLKKGDIVVYESTVYPGATEEDCVPVLEKFSGLRCGTDFKVGYSPERINPGDKEHSFTKILKVVSGQDAETLDVVAAVYGSVVEAGIHKASTIKVAEAAKVIENTQRDINIAFMNELSLIFQRMGIDTQEVLEAAGTKWNFLKFTPGLVGGHCIGVDPYYLTYKSERLGYHPHVILAGRQINDAMGKHVAMQAVEMLISADQVIRKSRINLLGLTFKENCPDVRNTKVLDIYQELIRLGIQVDLCDPKAHPDEVEEVFGKKAIPFQNLKPADVVILAAPHAELKSMLREKSEKVFKTPRLFVDVKGAFDQSFSDKYWRL